MSLQSHFLGVAILLLIKLHSSRGVNLLQPLTGFDCTHNPANVIEYSLNSVKDCEQTYLGPINKTKNIMIVQQNDNVELNVISCKIYVQRWISRCSMFSDLQAVPNGFAGFYVEMNLEKCRQIISTGTYYDYGTMTNLKVNGITPRPTILAGAVESNGKCWGAPYSDAYGSYVNVVVHANIEIELHISLATFNPQLDEVYLRTGTKCVFSAGKCFDPIRGPTFWDVSLQTDKCSNEFFTVLYEGPSHALSDPLRRSPTMYLVNTDKIAFSLKALKKTRVCHYDAFQTEHAKFFILEESEYKYPFRKTSNKQVSADLLNHLNFKFSFIETHISNSLRKLHETLLSASCRLDRQILEHELSLAITNPETFSFLKGGGSGYYSVVSGEVIYLLKCTPVPVQLRSTVYCYNEIPVYYQNSSKFLTPRTRILKSTGTIQDCSNHTPVKFEINGVWVAATPHMTDAKSPNLLEASPFINWTYESPKNMFHAGIFTQEDVQAFQRRIAYPLESSAAQSAVTRQAMGLPQPHQTGIQYENFLTQASLETIIQKTTRKIWGIFHEIGTIFAGFFGIIAVVRFVKSILDMFLFGKLLHEVFGFGWQMFACCCDSLSQYLVHNHYKKQYSTRVRPSSGAFARPQSDPFAGISFQAPQLENHYATPKPPEYQEFVCKPAEV